MVEDTLKPAASGPPRTADDPCYGGSEPLLVHVPGVSAEAREILARLAQTSGAALYAPLDLAAGPIVVGGPPEVLGLLRSLLLPVKSLRLARERIESALGGYAAPAGLPRLDESLYKKTAIAEEPVIAPGTTLLVSRTFTFDAAHNLPRYNGKCERLHGHTFSVKVTVKAPLDPWSGMAFDFHDLKKIVNERVVRILDHSYVNETVPNPSAECIAIWVWEQLGDLPLHDVTVWETPTCSVTYSGPPPRG